MVLAFFPGTKLPDTLGVQPTDTEVHSAISSLTSTVQAHAGEPWADEVLAGPFGTLAPKLQSVLSQLIAANKALSFARQERAMAFPEAYKKYLAFKRVVRDELGPSSIQYRRLHVRPAAAKHIEEDVEEAAPESSATPMAHAATTAPSSGPTSGKIA